MSKLTVQNSVAIGRSRRKHNRLAKFLSIVETLEVMSDQELMKSIRQSVAEFDAGKEIPWEEAKRDLLKETLEISPPLPSHSSPVSSPIHPDPAVPEASRRSCR
jgi:hypothetical protein